MILPNEQLELNAAEYRLVETLMVTEVRAGIAVEFDALQRDLAHHQLAFQQLHDSVQHLAEIQSWRWTWTRTLFVVCFASIISGVVIGIY